MLRSMLGGKPVKGASGFAAAPSSSSTGSPAKQLSASSPPPSTSPEPSSSPQRPKSPKAVVKSLSTTTKPLGQGMMSVSSALDDLENLVDDVGSLDSSEDGDVFDEEDDRPISERGRLATKSSSGHPHHHASLSGGGREAFRSRVSSASGLSDGSDEEDVVRRARTKRGPMGMLAGRGRRGSDGSEKSSSSSNDSFSSDEGELEDLIGNGPLDEDETTGGLNGYGGRATQIAKNKRLPLEVLRDVPFFSQFNEDHQTKLFSELVEELFEDGDTIVKQGGIGDRLYVIIEGEAVVSRTDEAGETFDLTHIYSGDVFGELILIFGGHRVASVTSVGKTKCMSLSRKAFEKYPDVRYFLILQRVPLVSQLSAEQQQLCLERLKPAKFKKGEFVVKQGDRGDAFFMITKGSVEVIEDEKGIITNLYEGHSFGEMSLLSDEPRVASVRASSDLNLMYLSAEDFKELLTGEEFSLLLAGENKKIRELRDRRQFKRSTSVSTPAGVRPPGMEGPGSPMLQAGFGGVQQMDISGDSSSLFGSPMNVRPDELTLGLTPMTPHDVKRVRGISSANRGTAQTQQKVKTSKTTGGNRVVNGYILMDQIGKGTFGVVRLCVKETTQEKFAIKIIDKSLFKSKIKSKHQTSLEDMRHEAAIMKKLNHENVVNLVDVIDDPKADSLYLVQEYCANGAIMGKLEGNEPLSEAKARKYFRDLLSGIDYLHAHNIAHRDIKPMNLLLTSDDVVKIGDFGAARVLQGNVALGIAGTPAFMAPELLAHDASLYNGPAVDLWSCGATLFMLVTGVPPWMADDEPTLSKRVQNDELVFPGAWGKRLSPHLRNLLTRLLVKEPAKRMTLTQTCEHEWVTDEGAEPLPRFVDLQPQLMRINSSIMGSITAAEKMEAISTVAEVPDTPVSGSSSRKQQAPGGPSASSSLSSKATAATAKSKIMVSSRMPSLDMAGLGVVDVDYDSDEPMTPKPDEEITTTINPRPGGSAPSSATRAAHHHHHHHPVSSMPIVGRVVAAAMGHVKPIASPSTPKSTATEGGRPASDSVDYSSWDVGKRRAEDAVSGGRATSGAFSAQRRKKMSVVQVFQRSGRILGSSNAPVGGLLSVSSSGSVTSSVGGMGSPSQARQSSKGSIYSSVDGVAQGSPLATRLHSGHGSHHAILTSSRHSMGTDATDEMSLSAILGDKGLFEDMQKAKRAEEMIRADQSLKPLPAHIKLIRAKRGHHVSHAAIRYGYGEHQGQRATMEDFVCIVPKLKSPDTCFVAIFDGHGGDMVAKELKQRMHKMVQVQPDFSSASLAIAASPTLGRGISANTSSEPLPTPSSMSPFGESAGLPVALRHAFLAFDRAILYQCAVNIHDLESRVARGDLSKSLYRTKGGGSGQEVERYRKSGSTAVCAMIRGGGKPKTPCVVTVGWVGDSRCVLCRGGQAVEISQDHKAAREDETLRIRAAGGTVDGKGRLYGDLAVSRAFGDFQHKSKDTHAIIQGGPIAPKGEEDSGSEGTLIACPDTFQFVVQPTDEFMVLASDGVWDVLENQQVCNFVRYQLNLHGDVRRAAAELVDKALVMGSVDNVSAVVVGFLKQS